MPAPSSPGSHRPTSSFWSWTLVLLAIAAGVHAAALWNSTPLQSANDRSRWSTVWALVERGTFAIDEIDRASRWQTIDKVQSDGHLYSTKPALLTVMSAEVYRLLRSTVGWSIYGDTELVTRSVLAVVNLIPFLLSLVALSAIASKYTHHRFSQAYVIAAGAFGTYLSTYSVTFNNHTVAAVSLIFALYFALRITADGSRRWWDFALCGLTSAFVTTNELPAAIFGVGMFALLFFYDWRRTLLVFVPAALIPIVGFFVTTWMQTGSWKPFYLSYGTEKYIYIRDGVPSYWAAPKGMDQNLDSPFVYFLNCTIGHHGILSLSPIFLLTLVTWARMWKRPAEPYRPCLWLGLVTTIVIIAFYLSRTENYNYGGNTVALRWAIWLVPFWLVALLPTLDDFGHRTWFRWVAGLLLAISSFSAWEAIGNPWRPSWLFSAMESAGWIDYSDVTTPPDHPLNAWFSSLPSTDAEIENEWIELQAESERGIETLRLELVSNDPERPRIRIVRSEGSVGDPARQSAFTATLDRTRFDAGEDFEAFVVAGEPSEALAERALRWLPADVPYRDGPIRYKRTSLRELAFRTRLITATVDVRRQTGGIIRHRIDAWICPDVPFGVVQLQETQSDAVNGQWLKQRTFVLSDAGRMDEPEWAVNIRNINSEKE